MILQPSKYLVNVPLKLNNKPYFIIYHSIFGGAQQINLGVWNLIQEFKVGRDFPSSFNKEEVSAYRNIVLNFKKRLFLVEKGKDERSLLRKRNRKFEDTLATGKYITNLRLEMASYCNFRCLHCFAPKIYAWKKGTKMSFYTAKLAIDGFIDILRKAGNKKGTLTFWGGEPLLNWDVIKQTVEYTKKVTKKYSIRISLGIITNGSLLDDQILKFLKLHRIDIRVSLDGLEKENDRFRKFIDGQGTFKSITKGMEGLSRYGIPFTVEICLNDYNFYSIEKMLDFVYKRYKCRAFVVSSIGYQKSVSNFNRHSNQEKAKRIVELYDYAIKKGRYIVNPAGGKFLMEKAIYQGHPPEHACLGSFTGLYVNPAGLVYNCQEITLPIGTVKQIKKVPQGKKYKYVATRNICMIKGCKGCEIEGFCAGGCAGITQFYSGDIYDTSDPFFKSSYCDFRRHLVKELLKHHLKQKSSSK